MTEIYQPAEDSYFFSEFLEKYLSKNKINSYLDMGTGSTILSETASKFLNKKNIFSTDINPTAVKLAKKKGFNAIKSTIIEDSEVKCD